LGREAWQAEPHVQPLLLALERGRVSEVVRHLETTALEWEERALPAAEAARKAANYFRHRREQVAYPHFVAAG